MAIADIAAYRALLAAPHQPLSITKTLSFPRFSGVVSQWGSYWTGVGIPAAGATPTVAAVCDRTTVGALGQQNPSAGALYASLRKIMIGCRTDTGGGAGDGIYKIMLADRLAHVGGMDGTLLTAQATGGMGITRYTNGVGVIAGIEMYTQVGTTAATFTASYTNQSGTAGRTSQPVVIDSTRRGISEFLPLSLAQGDTGVRDVASITLSASTLTAGNFGVTLYAPLLTLPAMDNNISAMDGNPLEAIAGYMPQVATDACLVVLLCGFFGAGAQATSFVTEIALVEA